MTSISSSRRLETVRGLQTAMAVSYTGMGSWCLLHPSSVLTLSLAAPYALVNRTTTLLMRCFGAQAMTVGLLLGTAPMDERSFATFGLAMVPYLAFNAWFGVGPGRGVFTPVLVLDFIGNVFFGLGSAYCVKLLREQQEADLKQSSSKSQ